MDNRNYFDEVAWFPWNIYSPLNAWKIMLPHHWLPKDNLILRSESAIWNNYRGGPAWPTEAVSGHSDGAAGVLLTLSLSCLIPSLKFISIIRTCTVLQLSSFILALHSACYILSFHYLVLYCHTLGLLHYTAIPLSSFKFAFHYTVTHWDFIIQFCVEFHNPSYTVPSLSSFILAFHYPVTHWDFIIQFCI